MSDTSTLLASTWVVLGNRQNVAEVTALSNSVRQASSIISASRTHGTGGVLPVNLELGQVQIKFSVSNDLLIGSSE